MTKHTVFVLLLSCGGLEAGHNDAGQETFCRLDCTATGCATGFRCAEYAYPKIRNCAKQCVTQADCPPAPNGSVMLCQESAPGSKVAFCQTNCISDSACSQTSPGTVCSDFGYPRAMQCQAVCTVAADCPMTAGLTANCIGGLCVDYGCTDNAACSGGMVCAALYRPKFRSCQRPCAVGSACPTSTGSEAVCR